MPKDLILYTAHSDLCDSASPLPYFALSHLLTLFSHDMATLPLTQHAFDWILVRPPIAVIYLCAAVCVCHHLFVAALSDLVSIIQFTLARKPDVMKLARVGEEGAVHSVLTALPELADVEESDLPKVEQEEEIAEEEDVLSSEDEWPEEPKEELVEMEKPPVYAEEENKAEFIEDEKRKEMAPPPEPELGEKVGDEPPDTMEGSAQDDESSHTLQSIPESAGDITETVVEGDTTTVSEDHLAENNSKLKSSTSLEEAAPAAPPTEEIPIPLPAAEDLAPAPAPATPKRKPRRRPKPKPISFPSVLRTADALLATYPPSNPKLHLTKVMGPASVTRHWSEDPSGRLATDAILEGEGEESTVVYPPSDTEDEPRRPRKRRRAARNQKQLQVQISAAAVALTLAIVLGAYVRKQGVKDWTNAGEWGMVVSLWQGWRYDWDWERVWEAWKLGVW